MTSAPLDALYNAAPIILWVEDLLTSFYLDALWGHEARIKMYVGGGHETLAAVVEDARRSGRRSIYSLRDRDFGTTNRPRWRETVHFALETFEIECFLLDPPALAACAVNTAGKDEPWIHAHLERQAADTVWWMACRAVIAGLREARQQDFPAHPKRREVTSQHHAEEFLRNNRWVQATAPGLRDLVAPARLRDDLLAAHDRYAAHLADATWIPRFSGKELLEGLAGVIYTKHRPAGPAGYLDLAKAVAAEQRRQGRVPAELQELKDTLLARLAG